MISKELLLLTGKILNEKKNRYLLKEKVKQVMKVKFTLNDGNL